VCPITKTKEHADRKETRNTIEKKDRETERGTFLFLTFVLNNVGPKKKKKKVR